MPLQYLLLLAVGLFALGAGVVFTRLSPVVMLCGIELMLSAGNLNLVAFSRLDPVVASGQIFALFTMAIAAAETAVALAILYAISRSKAV